MTEPTPIEYLAMPVRITRDGIYIGEHKMPGCILEQCITVKPGGHNEFNRVTIELVVGEILIEDPAQE